MTEGRKETFWRDEDGDFKDRVAWLIIVAIVLFVIGFITGMCAVSDYYEVKAFNRIHGSDYTFSEWFWAQYTIKTYHLGTVENKKYEIDVNLNKDKTIE